jgi:peptide/nickel transport system substrate-binding protein
MKDKSQVRMNRRTVLKTTSTAGALAVAGCFGNEDQEDFRVGSPWEVAIDPLEGDPTLRRLGITEALISVSHDIEPEPELASDWEQIDDTRWEFTLREDVTFHDGEPFTVEAAVSSLERTAKSEAFASVPIETVEQVNDSTIAVETEVPFSPLPAHLSRDEAVILSPGSFEDDEVTEPISTGPFAFGSLNIGSELRAARNDEYYGDVPTIESVRYEIVEDDQTRQMKLENGELEMARVMPQESVTNLEATEGIDVHTLEIPRIRFLTFDTQSEPFDDERVRQAVSYAIDRERITKSVLAGVDDPAVSPISPEMTDWADPDLEETFYNPDRARELLSEAGWTNNSNGIRSRNGEELSVEFLTFDERSLPIIGEAIQGQLEEVGINLELTIMEYGSMEDRVSQEAFDAYITSWGTLWYPDPDRLADMFHSDGDLHHGYENEEVDTLLEEAREIDDSEERKVRYHEVQSIVLEETPIAVLTSYTDVIATASTVDHYEPHPTEERYGLETVELDDTEN